MKKENNLKMSLDEIRSRIDVNKLDWENMHTTNCYAYALGLDIPQSQICQYAYDPGTIGQSKSPLYIPFSYNSLLDNIFVDLEALKIGHEFISPNDNLSPDEWKIAIFISQNYSLHDLEDFHLIRYRNDGLWYHKNGMIGAINNLDYYDQFITDPTTCDLHGYMYTDCLRLKLKKTQTH